MQSPMPVIDYPAEFGKDGFVEMDPLHVFEKPPAVSVASDPVVGGDVMPPMWYHHHHNAPQFDKLRGRVEEARRQHNIGGDGRPPIQHQGMYLLEFMKVNNFP